MIPADIGTELAAVVRAAVAAGDLPEPAAGTSADGTWRPAPDSAGGAPGTYATSLAFLLARRVGGDPVIIAERLRAGLAQIQWISAARVTGGGYLTVAVTAAHLAGLARRTATAGSAAVTSAALSGTRRTVPSLPELAVMPTWDQAWQEQRAAVAGRLAQAAGGQVLFTDSQRNPSPVSTTPAHSGPVRAALAYHGGDAVRYALARTANGSDVAIERQLSSRLDLRNPFVAVRHAHADAASTMRWAVDLGLDSQSPDSPGQQLLPPELALLDAISWLPERAAAAARRRRPAELAAHLEYLAGSWLDCRERCPALPFQGSAAPADADVAGRAARLELADAARTALAAGLDLLGVSAPARL